MPQPAFAYHIFPLGDSALTIDFGNRIDEVINQEVIKIFNDWKQQPPEGVTEIVPAYSSLTLYYDPAKISKPAPTITVFEWMKQQVHTRLVEKILSGKTEHNIIRIPVCYQAGLAPDFLPMASSINLTAEQLISIHTEKIYKVYMLGFLPGFPYMGEVDERIVMPRKNQPVNVAAGSVGIAGRQTGIYPLNSPGGWQIIGRTPLKLFDRANDEPTLLNAGDNVQFYSINMDEYQEMANHFRKNAS